MHKLMTLLLSLLLLLGALPTAALPTEDLTDLARYLPEDAPLFASIRSDAAYVETLDGVVAQVARNFPPLAALSVSDLLDQLATMIDPEADFDTLIRPWLGDTVAIGTLDSALIADPDNLESLRIVFSVADRAAAEAFLDEYVADFAKSESDGVAVYQDSDNGILYLFEDALLIAPGPLLAAEINLPQSDQTLANLPAFQETLAALPEDDYNAAAYFDVATLFDPVLGEMEEALASASMELDIEAALDAFGPQALGLTILEERSLVVDVAARIADPQGLAAAGFPQTPDIEPLNLDFLSNVPAGTSLVLHDQNLGGAVLDSLVQIEMLGEMFEEQFERGQLDFDQQPLTFTDDLVTFVRLSFQGMAGLTLDEALGWMSDDYVLFLDVETQNQTDVVPIMGLVVAGDDADAATATVDGFERLFVELDLFAEREGDDLVVPAFGDLLSNDALDIIFSADNGRFSISTRSAAVTGDSLLDTAAYEAASDVFLPETQTLAYIDMAELSNSLVSLGRAIEEPQLNLAAQLVDAFESASITAVYDEMGNGSVRLALTIPAAN